MIRSAEGYTYTGMTVDIDLRLRQHNDKSLSFWTKRGTNWHLIYSEKYESKSEAFRRERWLKTGLGREFIKKQLNNELKG